MVGGLVGPGWYSWICEYGDFTQLLGVAECVANSGYCISLIAGQNVKIWISPLQLLVFITSPAVGEVGHAASDARYHVSTKQLKGMNLAEMDDAILAAPFTCSVLLCWYCENVWSCALVVTVCIPCERIIIPFDFSKWQLFQIRASDDHLHQWFAQVLPLIWTLKSRSVGATWTPFQVQDSAYSPFTFIDLSHPSANRPVKNLILHSLKPHSLKRFIRIDRKPLFEGVQENLMVEVKKTKKKTAASEQEGRHSTFIYHQVKLLIWASLEE